MGLQQVGIEDNFFELGGDSLLATQFALNVRKLYAIDIPMRDFFDRPTISALACFIDSEAGGLNYDGLPAVFLEDLKLVGTIKTFKCTSKKMAPNNILLTGATGFIGIHLLAELCESTTARIYCLVRDKDTTVAKNRIIKQLNYYNLNASAILPRVQIILGDLAECNLGLSSSNQKFLIKNIDAIYHNGAHVHHLFDYSTLRTANVLGTIELLKIFSTRQVPIHYVSTLIAAAEADDKNLLIEDFPSQNPHNLLGGYQQSKWMAERILGAAVRDGAQVTVYRPNLVSGQEHTGICNPNDNHLMSLLKGCIQMKYAPNWDMVIDMLPVDHLCKMIVSFSKQPDCCNKVFNIINPHSPNWQDIIGWLKSEGHSIDIIPEENWINEHLVNVDKKNALYQLVSFYMGINYKNKSDKDHQLKVRTEFTDSYLRKVKLEYPKIDKPAFLNYYHYLRNINFI